MKKFLFTATLAVVACLTASAQLVQSTMFNEQKKENNTMWFLRVGMAMNNYAGNDDFADEDDEMGAKVGYDFSVGFHKPIADFGMYWGMEFGLGTRGYKMSYESDEGDYSSKNSILAHNVKISPITLGYKYSVTDWLKIDAHIGGYVSFDYAGKYKWEREYMGDTEDDDYNFSDDYFDDYNRFDAGIQAGVGLWFDRFNLDFTYQRGFIGMYDWDSEYDSPKSSNFMIRLGVAF